MTEQQGTELIALLTTVSGQNNVMIWVLTVVALGVGAVFGALTWRLMILAKNQRHFF